MVQRKRFNPAALAESLHVKKNTRGTSNELSLSVLDERRAQADEDKGAKGPASHRSFTFPRLFSRKSEKDAALGAATKRGVSGADLAAIALSIGDKGNKSQAAQARALQNPVEEIDRRKRARRIRRGVGLTLGLIAAAAVVGIAVYAFVGAYHENQTNLSLLSQGFTELESADDEVLTIDDALNTSASELSESQIQDLISQVSAAQVKLSSAEAFAATAKESLQGTEDAAAADQLVESAAARKEMLEAAQSLLSEELAATQAIAVADDAWADVLGADTLVKQAASLVADTTEENTRASQEKSEQAADLLQSASEKLTQAQGIYEADFSVLESYIAKRQESITYAIASDEAIYLQDKATAEQNNELYNTADAEAASIAAKLPKDASDPISDAYEAATQQTRETYLSARSRAAQADAFIRDYLGKTGQ